MSKKEIKSVFFQKKKEEFLRKKEKEEKMSIIDEIYEGLWRCAREGVPYEQVYARWGRHKSSFYDALARFLADAGTEVSRLSGEYGRLSAGVKEREQRLAELEGKAREGEARLSELGKREERLLERVKELEEKEKRESELLRLLRELKRAGVGMGELEGLLDALNGLSAKRGMEREEAVKLFFGWLHSLDSMLGFQAELRRLEARVETKRAEAEKWEAKCGALEQELARQSKTVEVLRRLERLGVGEHLPVWERILQRSGSDPSELAREIEEYGSLKGLLEANRGELKRLEEEVEALRGLKEGLVRYLASAYEEGLRRVKEAEGECISSLCRVAEKAERTLKGMEEGLRGEVEKLKGEVKSSAEVMREAGRLERELKMARALRAMEEDPGAVVFLGKGQIAYLLQRAALWCGLKGRKEIALLLVRIYKEILEA